VGTGEELLAQAAERLQDYLTAVNNPNGTVLFVYRQIQVCGRVEPVGVGAFQVWGVPRSVLLPVAAVPRCLRAGRWPYACSPRAPWPLMTRAKTAFG
jgi:hypothetical protein